MSHGNNSETAVERLIARCNESLQRGKDCGLASLTAYRDAGAALLELKEILPRGRFGPVARERCGCSKQWCARLMRLARDWDDVITAMSWAEGENSALLRKAYSPDGALTMLKAWRRAQSGDVQPEKAPRNRNSYLGVQREIAELKHQLGAAKAYVKLLEDKVAKLRPAAETVWRGEIGDQLRAKLEKIAALWLRGGTDGERFSAVNKIHDEAQRLGWKLRDLVAECVGPVHFPFASLEQGID
jgi:hypothetical protein